METSKEMYGIHERPVFNSNSIILSEIHCFVFLNEGPGWLNELGSCRAWIAQ
jgi:hypothetical protein